MKRIIRFSTVLVLVLSVSFHLSAKKIGKDTEIKRPTADQIHIAGTMDQQYLPEIEKTVSTQLISCYDWSIRKDFEKKRLHLMAGEKAKVNYEIHVDKKAVQNHYFLIGKIKVRNTNPQKVLHVRINEQVNGEDVKLEGTDNAGYISVNAGESILLRYEIERETKPVAGEAITSIQFYKTKITNSKEYTFTNVNKVSGQRYASISVMDASNDNIWTDITESALLKGSVVVDCSDISETDFIQGKYEYNLNSYARIKELNRSAMASLDVLYYAPVCALKSMGVTDPESNHKLFASVDIFNPHPTKEMKLELNSYFNLKPLSIKDSVLHIKPNTKTNFKFSENVKPAKYDYNDVQIYLNNVEFYLTEIICFDPTPIHNLEEKLLVLQ